MWFVLLSCADLDKCPHFYNLANGYFEKYSRNVSYVMNFNCDEGYHLEGSRISTCMRSENNVTYWTNPLPKCVRGMIGMAALGSFKALCYD